MKTLRQAVGEALAQKTAIGHFNIANLETLHAIVVAAVKLGQPVIIGTAEGERKFIGTEQAVALVKALRAKYNHPIYLNADHTYSFEGVKEAIDAGYDSVIFDGTKLPFEENIKITKQCVEYARSVNPDILVEAELGFIGAASQVLDGIPAGVKITEEFLTKPEEAIRFLQETGVDMLAPAVGNIHGMLKGGIDPALNTKRVGEIALATKVPLVLHGASGNSAEDIKASIQNGVAIVHVNTELRFAYRNALEQSLKDMPTEMAPYKYLAGAVEAVEKVVEEKIKIFTNK